MITLSAPEYRNAKAQYEPSEVNAQRRGLASALEGLGQDDPGTLAAIRRNCGLASLQRWLSEATSKTEVIEALLATTRDLVDSVSSYAAFVDGQGGAIHVLRRAPNGTQSHVFDANQHDLTSAPSGRDLAYWERVLRQARQTLASPGDPGDGAWITLPLTTLDGAYGALGVALPEGHRLAADEEASLRAAAEMSAAALQQLHLRRERDALRQDLADVQAQLKRLRERIMLSESLATIGGLVSSVAHELNNPLTSVIGFAQLLQTLDVDEDVRSDLAIIDSEARRCQRIVQNLLGLARQQDLDLASVQVNEMVHRTLELKAYSLRIDNIDTMVDLDPRLPPVIANPCKLQQALLNLVNNAHEAMVQSRTGGTLLIRTEAATLNGRPAVRVSVADDGPGVPPEVRRRLFEPFISTKRQQNGTGLGLAIARQVAEECGGRLVLDDAHTPGAKFDLELPVDNAAPAPAAVSWPAEGELTALAPRGAPAGARVLLVDDEVELVDMLTRVLAEDGHVVEHAPGGREALQRLAEGDYDLVLLDVRMPGLGGQEVYRVIRQDYPGLADRVILTTGDLVCSPISDWLPAAGCPVLEKPFDLAQLRAAVASVLDAARVT